MEYKEAGIDDIKEFYKTKFAFNSKYDFSRNVLNWYNINNFKQLWIYSNIKENSRVLDFGCGSGTLSCLKQKNCYLVGVDYSSEGVELACQVNRYDKGFAGSIFDFDIEDKESFDYIVSLDVFGHISFDEKDEAIMELKKYLKKDGVMLHGIECGNIDYDSMSAEELKNFVNVDGHIGMEGKIENEFRFGKFFKNVNSSLRYDCIIAVEELIKQADLYGAKNVLNQLMLDYVRSFSTKEKLSYNVALGTVMRKMFDLQIPSNADNGGFLFLAASDAEIAVQNMENEMKMTDSRKSIQNDNIFMNGWYDPENSEALGDFRWMDEEGTIVINRDSEDRLVTFKLGTGNPRVANGQKDCVVYLENRKDKKIQEIKIEKNSVKNIAISLEESKAIIKLYAEDLFVPAYLYGGGDERRLSIYLYDFKIL